MNSIQANNRILPSIHAPKSIKPKFLSSYPYVVCFNAKLPVTNSLKLFATASSCQQQFAPLPKHKRYASMSILQQGTTPCRLWGEDTSAGDNKSSLRKAIAKAIGSFGEQQSIEDVLKQQIEKQEYFDEDSGKNPPRGGGGNGGFGGGGSGGSKDEGHSGILDETLQVILATFAFILLYLYIITGEEIALLVKDYIRFLSGGSKSARLSRFMYTWGKFFKFFELLTEKKKDDKYWLQKAKITTPTWYDSSGKHKRVLKSHLELIDDDDDEGGEDEQS
ncbi:uncharacterized protein LOC111303811 [Durio zibethinus]|uniref:Uncharacterized protein LOC111303811 n=1 Tax=Durio zibethinus TaxID=66656 RepID=A0A6P5ZU98_DURZI|nr:uncharacterized protein LOC111303811 [Durio zibethinus]